MHNFDNKYQNIVYAVMTNKKLTDDERAKVIAEFIEEFKNSYPNLEHTATKQELTQTELKLTKDIEGIRLEIKEVESNLQKEMKEIESNLQKEIESVRLEIKEVDTNLKKEIKELEINFARELSQNKTDILKWMFGMFVAFSGLFLTAFKFLN